MSNVHHPTHYKTGGIEAIDVIEAWGLGFCLGNTIKYISRAGRKDPNKTVEDLQKAAWYTLREAERLIKKEIARVEEEKNRRREATRRREKAAVSRLRLIQSRRRKRSRARSKSKHLAPASRHQPRGRR